MEGIHAKGRFVEQQQRRVDRQSQQCAQDRAVTGGQLEVWGFAVEFKPLCPGKKLLGRKVRIASLHPAGNLVGVEFRKPGFFGRQENLLLCLRIFPQRLSLPEQLTVGGLYQIAHHSQQGCFSGTVASAQTVDSPVLQMKVQPVESGDRAKALAYIYAIQFHSANPLSIQSRSVSGWMERRFASCTIGRTYC